MPYEVFTRKIQRAGTPTMSFSKTGQIVFNQTAARILQKETIENILLLWDTTENKVGIKSTSNKKDQRAYRIRYADKGNGGAFSAKTFMDHIGLDYSERKSLPIEINPNHELLIEAKLPDSFFKRKAHHPRLVEKGRAG
jgi:hypothetical protein